MNDNIHSQIAFEENSKSIGIAYLLWLILGGLGVHRFYAGRTKSGIAQLLLALSVVGWLVLIPWLIADLFLIPGMVNQHNMKIIDMINGPAPERVAKEPMHKVQSELDPKREAMLEDLRSTGYRRERRNDPNIYP